MDANFRAVPNGSPYEEFYTLYYEKYDQETETFKLFEVSDIVIGEKKKDYRGFVIFDLLNFLDKLQEAVRKAEGDEEYEKIMSGEDEREIDEQVQIDLLEEMFNAVEQ